MPSPGVSTMMPALGAAQAIGIPLWERNGAGLAVFARAAHLHHGIEWQDHHDVAHRAHPGNRGVSSAGGREYWHAADFARIFRATQASRWLRPAGFQLELISAAFLSG